MAYRILLRMFAAAFPLAATAATVFVTNERAGMLTAIDPRTDKVVGTYRAGTRPRGIALSPDGKRVFLAVSHFRGEATRDPDGVLEVDAATGRVVRRHAAGTDPEGIDLSPDGKQFYVSNEDAGTATAVDVASGRAGGTFVTGTEPEGIGASPDGPGRSPSDLRCSWSSSPPGFWPTSSRKEGEE